MNKTLALAASVFIMTQGAYAQECSVETDANGAELRTEISALTNQVTKLNSRAEGQIFSIMGLTDVQQEQVPPIPTAPELTANLITEDGALSWTCDADGAPTPSADAYRAEIERFAAAVAAFEALQIDPPVLISLAKKNEEIYRPGDSEPLVLSRHSFSLRLLQYVRDEAHRFAQHYHHILRNKSTFDKK